MKLPVKTPILGIGISHTSYDEAADLIVQAGKERRPLTVSALAVHGLMTGVLDPAFGAKLNAFDILAPDGQPVRFAVNRCGKAGLTDRVYGPNLMLRVCEVAARSGVGIYLFGSTTSTIEALGRRLAGRFPGLVLSGWQADRFRDATPEEDEADMGRIRASGAGIVFCGRGCPRQEHWCHDHRARIAGACVAVGAAFDFHAGVMPQAPLWMQRNSLEWLFRLAHEPRRLWRRYLLLNPLFVAGLLLQMAGVRFPEPRAR